MATGPSPRARSLPPWRTNPDERAQEQVWLLCPPRAGRRFDSPDEGMVLPDVSGRGVRPAGFLPEMRHGAGAQSHVPRGRKDNLHLPDAPGGAAGNAGRVSEMRHGARADRRPPRGRRRTPRHDAALPGRRGAEHPRGDPRHGRPPAAARPRSREPLGVASIPAQHAGRPLGRLAVFRARGAFGAHAPSEHVYSHRAGHRRRLRVQRRGAAGARPPAAFPAARTGAAGLFRGGGGDHHARPPRPGAGTSRPGGHRRGPPRPAGPGPEGRPPDLRRRGRGRPPRFRGGGRPPSGEARREDPR